MNKRSIWGNSFWYGLETAADVVVNLASSVAVARVIGPERLGHFVYLMFLVNLAGRLGGFGPGAAARKYLSEHLGRGEHGLARQVFFTMLRWHVALGIGFAVLGWAAALLAAEPGYRTVACVLVASIIPCVINTVPSQANMAAQDFRRNVPAALISLAVYGITVALSLALGWGLTGVAWAVLLRRGLEMALRLPPALAWARRLPRLAESAATKGKLARFSGEGLLIALVMILVWDRSELLFLKHFCDIRQVAYYSIAFSLTEYLLFIPNVWGSAVSARLMAEHGHLPEQARATALASIRRLALIIVPLHAGIALLSGAAVRIVYGQAYAAAVPALGVAVLLAIPKAFYWLPSTMLQAADRQKLILRALLVVAVLNLGLDAALIPAFGAVGAAAGNGIAQAAAVFVLLWETRSACGLRLPWPALARIVFPALAMCAVVASLAATLPPLAAVLAGSTIGLVVYVLLIRCCGALDDADLHALQGLEDKVPQHLRRSYGAILRWIATRPGNPPRPRESAVAVERT